MNLHEIHTAFVDLLEPHNLVKQRNRRKIGMSGQMASQYRFYLNHGKGLHIETKIKWLKKAGIPIGTDQRYTRTDMLDFLRFSRRQDSQRSATTLGDEYLLDKYFIWVQQGRPRTVLTGLAVDS